ncbi:translocase of the inner membrane [Boothiomyces sp. JEL0838]|nr:translocase of the inner membrane [Boothiomyces sp. JEL0838]KAJ3314224.1 translocase of the inner membrane [Boothiomyces sp. JEL0838]
MTKSNDHSRDPCPYVIVYDVGIGFGMGAVLGTLQNTYKGFRNSPRGERIGGIVSAVKQRAPILAGNFAVWSGMFNACDCALVQIRGKEDAWNPIIAGASTGVILAVRSGPAAMAISGIFGGVILAAMEGAGSLIGKFMGGSIDPQPIMLPEEMAKAPQPQPKKKEEIKEPQPAAEPQEPKRGFFPVKFGIQH